jgi:hypothetical protein
VNGGTPGISVKEGTRAFVAPERALPGMLGLLHESVPAPLAQEQRKLFVHVLLQLFGIALLNPIKNLFQLAVDSFLRFQQYPIEIGKNTEVSHVGKTPCRKFLTAP